MFRHWRELKLELKIKGKSKLFRKGKKLKFIFKKGIFNFILIIFLTN